MFGLFKKTKATPPPLPTGPNPVQRGFATTYIQTSLTNHRAGFTGAMLSPEADQVLGRCWARFAAKVLQIQPVPSSEGLSAQVFREGQLVLVFITFPTPRAPGEAYFGLVLLGPCSDPQWSPDARAEMPFRYFVLCHSLTGTTVEEWTTDTPTALGSGPDPEPPFFVEWVLNHAVRATADTTVTVRSGSDDVAAAIARARSEPPSVLQRFIAGELHDASFTVKVPITDGEFTEHSWVSDTTYGDGRFSGIIDADPQSVSTVKRGDRWTASVEDVTDWMYAANQKMHGNYTLRALLPKLPPDEAAKYRAVLADEGA